MNSRWFAIPLACAGALLGLTGCGGQSIGPCVPVQGRVTLGDTPLVGGTITFVPQEDGRDVRPQANIDDKGFYSLKTAGREGAPPGKYRALVTTSGSDKTQDEVYDPVYSHWDNSPLIIDVVENAPAGSYDLKLAPR